MLSGACAVACTLATLTPQALQRLRVDPRRAQLSDFGLNGSQRSDMITVSDLHYVPLHCGCSAVWIKLGIMMGNSVAPVVADTAIRCVRRQRNARKLVMSQKKLVSRWNGSRCKRSHSRRPVTFASAVEQAPQVAVPELQEMDAETPSFESLGVDERLTVRPGIALFLHIAVRSFATCAAVPRTTKAVPVHR